MSYANIIGRNKEINILDRIYKSKKSELVAIYGRRRVGKTYKTLYVSIRLKGTTVGMGKLKTEKVLK